MYQSPLSHGAYHVVLHTENTGADPEIFHGGWLPVLYYTEPWGWMASNDRPIPIVYSLQISNGINPPPWINPCMKKLAFPCATL